MEYNVMLQRKNGVYSAVVPTIPGLTRTGKTKERALSAMRDALEEFTTSVEWVTIDVSAPTHNPWLETAGMFADDETLLPMMEHIYQLRDEE